MFPSAVNAATLEELQTQVQALMAQIATLQSQQGLTSSLSASRSCPNLPRTLSRGMRGNEVTELQEFLIARGLLTTDLATGYFGALTESAVQAFQRGNDIVSSGSPETTGYGAVGPRTRALLSSRWCATPTPVVTSIQLNASPTQGQAPLTVTFSSWVSGFRTPGASYTIDFGDGTSEPATSCDAPTDYCQRPGQNTHTYATNGEHTATLVRTSPCPANTKCEGGQLRETLGSARVVVQKAPLTCPVYGRATCGANETIVSLGTDANGCSLGYQCKPKSTACPDYQRPRCGSDEQLVSGGIGANGCPLPSQCVPKPAGATCRDIRQIAKCDGTWATAGTDANSCPIYECRQTVPTDPANDPQCKRWTSGTTIYEREYPGGPAMPIGAIETYNPGPPTCTARF